MIFPQIRCNLSAAAQNPNVFYIISTGETAGKPSLAPWEDSYMVICQNKGYFYFWLVYALHQTGHFKTRNTGTDIPCIKINDIRDLVREQVLAPHPVWTRFRELVLAIDNLTKTKSTLEDQVKVSEYLQKYLVHIDSGPC